MIRVLSRTVAAAAVLLVPVLATADSMPWENAVAVSVTVNGHAFHDAKVKSEGCVLSHELYFAAPENGYADPKNLVRNRHSFMARIKFAGGQTVTSNRFGNGAAGERVYRFDEDTSGAASGTVCWAKARNKIVKLDVIGCRGRGCELGQFE